MDHIASSRGFNAVRGVSICAAPHRPADRRPGHRRRSNLDFGALVITARMADEQIGGFRARGEEQERPKYRE
jgi:hypothetical protein